jgi:hypothetical protein
MHVSNGDPSFFFVIGAELLNIIQTRFGFKWLLQARAVHVYSCYGVAGHSQIILSKSLRFNIVNG